MYIKMYAVGEGPWQSHGSNAYFKLSLISLLQFSEGWLQYSSIFQPGVILVNLLKTKTDIQQSLVCRLCSTGLRIAILISN